MNLLQSSAFTNSILLLALIASSVSLASGQQGMRTIMLVKPSDEKFVERDDLVMPFRSIDRTCSPALAPNPRPNCHLNTGEEWQRLRYLTIYDSTGDVWLRFSVEPKDPEYFMKVENHPLEPLGPSGETWSNGYFNRPEMVILRLVGESPDWYRVEVNEQTRETRYVLKSDPVWARTDWYGIFNMSFNVVVDQTKVKLRDKPNGDVIERCANSNFRRMNFAGLDGDWMELRAGSSDTYGESCNGWLRWRDGRNILVGSILNGMKIPNTQASENK